MTQTRFWIMLKHVQQATGVSTLHVTHHMQDVRQLGDSLFKMENGTISQQAIDRNGRAPLKQQLQHPTD